MNTFTKTEVFLSVFVQKRSSVNGALYSLRQVTEVKLGRVRSDFGWVTTET